MSSSRNFFIYGVLLIWCTHVPALSLGNVQGHVWLGKPLSVQIPIDLDSNEVSNDLCIRALLPSSNADSTTPINIKVINQNESKKLILIESRQSVQELIINFEIAIGCTHEIKRYYTLLVDPEPTLNLPINKAEVNSTIPAQSNQNLNRDNNIAIKNIDKKKEFKQEKILLKQKNETQSVNSKNNHSKLQLDWITDNDPKEIISISALRLHLSTHIDEIGLETKHNSTTSGTWKLIQSSLEDQIKIIENQKSIEANLKENQEQINTIKKDNDFLRASIIDLKNNWYLHPSFLLTFISLILSWILFIAIHLRTKLSKKNKPWWKETKNDFPEPTKQHASSVQTQNSSKEQSLDHLDLDSLFPEHERLSDEKIESKIDLNISNFSNSILNEATRSVATEELFDLQQQVEFFISLGQTHQAITILKEHINESQEPSPLAYLDLLKLQYDLGLENEYELTRKEFNKKFNAGTPPFEKYTYSRRSLERYPLALSRIQSLWPSPAVLDLLEKTIFRQNSNDEPTSIFDLEAYRELLLLYGIASELNHHQDTPLSFNTIFSKKEHKKPPFEISGFPQFSTTMLQPLDSTMADKAFADFYSDNKNTDTAQTEKSISESQIAPDFLIETLTDISKVNAIHSEKSILESKEVFTLASTKNLNFNFSDLDTIETSYKFKKSDSHNP